MATVQIVTELEKRLTFWKPLPNPSVAKVKTVRHVVEVENARPAMAKDI